MVILSAAVTTKNGRALLSRQFVDMNRLRVEGLLAAFPKLQGTGNKSTFYRRRRDRDRCARTIRLPTSRKYFPTAHNEQGVEHRRGPGNTNKAYEDLEQRSSQRSPEALQRTK